MKKDVWKKFEIEIGDVLAAATPFKQGNSYRLTIPREIIDYFYEQKGRDLDIRRMTLAFIETSRGLLVKPLKEVAKEAG